MVMVSQAAGRETGSWKEQAVVEREAGESKMEETARRAICGGGAMKEATRGAFCSGGTGRGLNGAGCGFWLQEPGMAPTAAGRDPPAARTERGSL